MHSIITKLVILWLFVGSGLIAFGLGFVVLAAAMAFFSVDTTDRPPLADFMEAGCEIESSLMNPSTIGLESRILRFIAIDPDHGIDFRALPDRWRHVCLTSVSSGSPDLSGGYRLPFLRFERSLCWGWSRRAITVLLIKDNGATFPFQLNVPAVIGGHVVDTSPSTCSPVKDAQARCQSVDGTSRSCQFVFPGSAR